MRIVKLGKIVIENDQIDIESVHTNCEGQIVTDTDLLVSIRNHVYNLFTQGIRGETTLNIAVSDMRDTNGQPVPQRVVEHFHQLSKKEH